MGVDDEFGGPLAQADFCGSCVGSFGADATEDLLILINAEKFLNEEEWRIGWERLTKCNDLASFDIER